MSFSDRHNKGQNQFTFRLESEGDSKAEFKKLSELDPDSTYVVRGFFISKAGKFGKHPVAVVTASKTDDTSNGFFVDFPKSSLDEVEDILKNPEDVQDINDMKVGFTTHKYDNKYGKDFTGFTFCDI